MTLRKDGVHAPRGATVRTSQFLGLIFFFSSRRRHTRFDCDWSSDVCSSDLEELVRGAVFNELDIRALRSDLIAVGNDPLVSNRAGGAPTTIISPSLLFDELEEIGRASCRERV